jgi:general nucleoside transport system permease protein
MAVALGGEPIVRPMDLLIRFANKHPTTLSLTLSILSVLFAFLIGAVLIAFAGLNPWNAYGFMLRGTFGNLYGFGETLTRFVPMALAGMGFSIAYKSGFFNVGGEGQLYMGAIGALLTAVYLQGLPPLLHVTLAMLAGFVFGALWALIAGVMKITIGANELITTMMLNYIAILLSEYLIKGPLKDPNVFEYISYEVPVSAQLPFILPGTRLHFGIVVALLAAIAMYFFMWRTPIGYQLRTIGANAKAAAYAGMNLLSATIIAVIAAGGLAGLGGAAELLGIQRIMVSNFSPGFGFDGIGVAVMGRHNPAGIVLSTLLFAIVRVGAGAMQRGMGVPFPLLSVIEGLVILMVISSGYLSNKLTTTVIGGRA